jgi:hypothetical protein
MLRWAEAMQVFFWGQKTPVFSGVAFSDPQHSENTTGELGLLVEISKKNVEVFPISSCC